MGSKRNLTRAAGLILLAAAISGGCENSEVLAPADSTMVLTAAPNPVIFETTAGTLASNGAAVETDNSSIAVDTLTLDVTDPDSIDVTATSGSLTKKVTITKTLEGVAPSDGTLALSGPSSVTIDPANDNETEKTVSVAAVVKDKAGQPVANVPITIQPTGCTVTTSPVTTDATGTATAELIVKLTDYVQCSIFAQAGALTATASIAKSVSSAPDGANVDVSANPPQITIYVNQGQTSGNTAVTAVVTTADGRAIPGIAVSFTTSGGQLGSTNVVTDNQGRATVTLTMTVNDSSPALVLATANPVTSDPLNVPKVEVTSP